MYLGLTLHDQLNINHNFKIPLKMRSFKTFQSSCKNVPACISRAMMIMFLLVSTHMFINAQATLSLQGILKKANGIALEDDTYPITFKIYVVDSTKVKWYETIDDVEVTSGIYSVILGANPMFPLNLAFDKDYELGISIGSQEMKPRVKLTSAPYALALRGSTNQFPSSGQVLADSILINGGIKVNNGVLASGGAPGANGVDKNGYAFTGNNGDNDSGLFSTAAGKASLYSNNKEILSVTPGTVTIDSSNLNIVGNGSVKYNGVSDWRLVDVDDFTSDHDGWAAYSPSTSPFQYTGWNSADSSSLNRIDYGAFVGHVLTPGVQNATLKKRFIVNGSFTQIKVKFKYYRFDSWDNNPFENHMAFAGFASSVLGDEFRVGWTLNSPWTVNFTNAFNRNSLTLLTKTDINNNNVPGAGFYTDTSLDVEMTARRKLNNNNFWVYIGAFLDEAINNESYGIGPVEIWVR